MREGQIDESSGTPIQPWFGLLVACLYGATSISITFFNKAVLSVYDFPYSNTLTLGQMVFSLVLLWVMKRLRLMKYKDFNIQTAAAVIPLSFFFFAMVVTGLGALRYVNVPMFGAIRRLTTLIVILGEGLILHKQYPKDEAWSVYLMVLGAFIAGLGDLTFHLLGYILCLLNCVVTAGYLVYIAKIKNETLLDTFGMMFYNNLLSIPFVLVAVVFTELEDILAYPLWQDFGFLICFLMSSLQAFLLNYFIFLCSTANSPLTTSVTGQIKNIFTTVIGLFLFGDVQFSVLLSLGLLIATLASMWYTHIKYQQQVQQEKAKQASYPTSHIITPPRIPNNRDD